jgi:hypothetical protein
MRPKQIKASDFKGVSKIRVGGKYMWLMSGAHNGQRFVCRCETERAAAIMYDKKMIEIGKKPVNILKPVLC